MTERATLLIGDCRETLRTLPDASVNCCVTSPPYWGLRDYGHEGQIGLEQTPEAYVAEMVAVFREVRRVLRDDGTVWLNLGDTYNSIGHKKSSSGYGSTGLAGGIAQEHTPLRHENTDPDLKHKDLVGIPWRVAFALQADGWYLRQDIIWHKPNPMPESVTDRCTKSHEYVFLLAKSANYYYDAEAIKEPVKQSSIERLSQPNLANQKGSDRVPGKTNGNMKAVGAGRRSWNGSAFDDGKNLGVHPNVGNRSKANSFKHEGSKREQAIPGQTVGTHRPDRAESEYSLETRNKRSVWTVCTQPYRGAHFATFPPKLIEPCIMAGCPSKVCAVCGSPWERQTERTDEPDTSAKGSRFDAGKTGGRYGGDRTQPGERTLNRTIGHRQTCDCGGETRPGVTLDPFNGAGTTGLVALQQGRHYIGCELNPEYSAMSRERWRPELEQGRLAL